MSGIFSLGRESIGLLFFPPFFNCKSLPLNIRSLLKLIKIRRKQVFSYNHYLFPLVNNLKSTGRLRSGNLPVFSRKLILNVVPGASHVNQKFGVLWFALLLALAYYSIYSYFKYSGKWSSLVVDDKINALFWATNQIYQLEVYFCPNRCQVFP